MQYGLIKRNTYFIALSYGGQLLMAFILTKIATDKLGVDNFGIYMFASIMGYFLFLLNDLGLVTYMVREVSGHRDKASDYFKNALILKWILLGFLIPVLILYIKLSGFEEKKMWSVLAFFVFGFFFSLTQLCYAVYRAHEKMQYEMIANLCEKLLITGAGALVLFNGGNVVALCAVFGGASIINFTVNSVVVRRKFHIRNGQYQWNFMIRLFKAACLFGLFWILTNVHERVDVLMLEHIKHDDKMIGWYTLAYKLILVANLIPIVLITASFPRISKSVHTDPNELERIYRLGMKYLLFIALPMVVGTLFLADDLCTFFGDFKESGAVLRVLIFACGIDFFSIFFAAFLMAWNRQRDLTLLQGGALLMNVLANLVLIHFFSYMGAAYATLASRGLIFALCAIWVVPRLHNLDYRALVMGIITTGIMAFFLWLWKGPLFLRMGLACVIYIGLLVLMGGIRSSELFIINTPAAVSETMRDE